MLEDYRKGMVERGDKEQFTSDHIKACMEKVITVDLKQTVRVDEDLEIRAYYASHVIGAAMIYARVGDSAIVYTGDYNMTTDRLLGAVNIDRLQLDLLITESTNATTVRDTKYAHERQFLKDELCILLEGYWERMNLKVPIYFSPGMLIQVNMYHKMLISWTSQKAKEASTTRNAFDFKHVCDFDRSLINAPGPCVLFATPGMLNPGFSLEVFKHWATSEKNLVALHGANKFDLDKKAQFDVRCQIHQLAFSAHTDSKGIMDLVKFLSPKHVILVHGQKDKMAILKGRILNELGIPCDYPANNKTVSISSARHFIKADASAAFIRSSLCPNFDFKSVVLEGGEETSTQSKLEICDSWASEGLFTVRKNKIAKIVCQDD